ncbi:hypothetical protein GCM10029964_041850 [Kibdelosporangium lantanae]
MVPVGEPEEVRRGARHAIGLAPAAYAAGVARVATVAATTAVATVRRTFGMPWILMLRTSASKGFELGLNATRGRLAPCRTDPQPIGRSVGAIGAGSTDRPVR